MVYTYAGCYQFTFRWIVIGSIWLILNFTPIIQADQLEYINPCTLTIDNEEMTYLKFKKLTKLNSVSVIFFNTLIGNQAINKDFNSIIYYAWIKNNFGAAILTSPSSFIAMSFSLYTIFTTSINISLIESTQGCYNLSSNDGQKYIIFEALVNFTKLNGNCNDGNCSTICLRRYSSEDGNFNTKHQASCCQRDTLDPQVNITQCISSKVQLPWYVPWFTIAKILLSVFIAGYTLNKIINWFLDSIQR